MHAVDKTHAGKDDSSVMYIPACPLTEANAENLARQREAFLEGTSPPGTRQTKSPKLTGSTTRNAGSGLPLWRRRKSASRPLNA